MNGQQHTQDALPFTFYAEPVVSQLRYDRGPVSGGTSVAMSGSSFRGGSAYRCRFGAIVVAGTYVAELDELRCLSPTTVAAGGVALEASLNGQQFSSSAVLFVYYAEATVSHLVPSGGPRHGGSRVTVFGAGFEHAVDARCMLGLAVTSVVVLATVDSSERMRCTLPAARCGPGECTEVLEVSLNSESFS